jgi:nucleoside-diphosphate-sugar epimerase
VTVHKSDKIVLAGAAGLVGQNLAVLLSELGYTNLVGIDKHPHNALVLSEINPGMTVINADLSQPGDWMEALRDARALVMLQAQIGGQSADEFTANNITSTRHVLDACSMHRVPYIVHVSSSVVNSLARDYYTESKRTQETMVRACGIPHVVLRPTLMFGWFDRKHLGWLSRFMSRTPLFPVPGSGRYPRQPLYNRDFCRVIEACLRREPLNEVHDISGLEIVDYVDIIRAIKTTTCSRTPIVRVPYALFWILLRAYAFVDRNPPFTTQQLEALVIPETFPLTSWGESFGVRPTPFHEAIEETFGNSRFARIELKF